MRELLSWLGLDWEPKLLNHQVENRHHQSFHNNGPHLISVHVGHPDDDDGQEMMGDVATSSLETTADQIVRPVYRLVSPLHESEHNLEQVFDTERQLRDGVEKSQTR